MAKTFGTCIKWYTGSPSMGLTFLCRSIPSSDANRLLPAAVEGTTSTDVTDEKWPELAITASVLTRWQKRGYQHALNQRHCYVRKTASLYWITIYGYVNKDVCHLVPADSHFPGTAVWRVKYDDRVKDRGALSSQNKGRQNKICKHMHAARLGNQHDHWHGISLGNKVSAGLKKIN